MPQPSAIRQVIKGKKHARSVVRRVCTFADQSTWVDDLQLEMRSVGLVAAVENHDIATIFNWLMRELSFQGISDTVAEGYMDRHGNVTWGDIQAALYSGPECGKLEDYWTFTGCRYHKTAQTCAEPKLFNNCPLPQHPLRNGRLNQTAYSLFLFIRDVADSDIVRWIDQQLTGHFKLANLASARAALLDPLRNVYGVSDKVIAMALAGLLMGAGATRNGWFAVGASFIVVDTLVHNFLHRTGILRRLGATHLYGPACYQQHGCADVLFDLAKAIDARRFNPEFPKVFPRLIQRAIWRYCAEAGFDICNGNQIDDRGRCKNSACDLYSRCDRLPLNKPKKA